MAGGNDSGVYAAKDYVQVVDGDGNPVAGFAHPVPKAWVGTDLLPPGTKAKGRSNKAQADKDPADSSGEDNKTGSEGS